MTVTCSKHGKGRAHYVSITTPLRALGPCHSCAPCSFRPSLMSAIESILSGIEQIKLVERTETSVAKAKHLLRDSTGWGSKSGRKKVQRMADICIQIREWFDYPDRHLLRFVPFGFRVIMADFNANGVSGLPSMVSTGLTCRAHSQKLLECTLIVCWSHQWTKHALKMQLLNSIEIGVIRLRDLCCYHQGTLTPVCVSLHHITKRDFVQFSDFTIPDNQFDIICKNTYNIYTRQVAFFHLELESISSSSTNCKSQVFSDCVIKLQHWKCLQSYIHNNPTHKDSVHWKIVIVLSSQFSRRILRFKTYKSLAMISTLVHQNKHKKQLTENKRVWKGRLQNLRSYIIEIDTEVKI